MLIVEEIANLIAKKDSGRQVEGGELLKRVRT
jgi:hypothetical protein